MKRHESEEPAKCACHLEKTFAEQGASVEKGSSPLPLSQGKVEILQYELAMLKQLETSTILARGKALKSVNTAVNRRDGRTNILNASAVSMWLEDGHIKPNRKYKLVQDLQSFYTWKKISWQRPKVKREYTDTYLPRLADILLLIDCVTNFKLKVFLQLLKETAARAGEAWMLRWRDIDFRSRLVGIKFPEKNSRQRTLKVSQRLIDMFNHLSRKGEFLFHDSYNDPLETLMGLESFRRLFELQRKRIAKAHPSSEVMKIHFHSFRVWRATMQYLKARDLETVMTLLGATNILHARRYVRLAQAIQSRDDDYVTAKATTPDEVDELAREGFAFVSEIQGVQIFRKETWLVEKPFSGKVR